MQACVTKWFKPMDPSKHGQYHEWLFEKEKADREKRLAERDARIKEVRMHLKLIRSATKREVSSFILKGLF